MRIDHMIIIYKKKKQKLTLLVQVISRIFVKTVILVGLFSFSFLPHSLFLSNIETHILMT